LKAIEYWYRRRRPKDKMMTMMMMMKRRNNNNDPSHVFTNKTRRVMKNIVEFINV
jgi:hypothetical protein